MDHTFIRDGQIKEFFDEKLFMREQQRFYDLRNYLGIRLIYIDLEAELPKIKALYT